MMINLRLSLVFIWLLAALLLPAPVRAEAPLDWDIAGGHFFGQTSYVVRDTAEARFWSEFRRLGGVAALGYPISRPYQVSGLHYQAFQRAILQWNPTRGQANLTNVFDLLTEVSRDNWLYGLGIPRPLRDSGGNWDRVVAERESWLSEPAIARAYRDGGGADRFGLPQSRPEPHGPFVVQRFQRIAFQLWLVSVEGMPEPGTVVPILAGDIVKEVGLIPREALVAETPPLGEVQVVAAVQSQTSVGDEAAVVEAEQTALALINQSRQQFGWAPVAMDAGLQRVARAHALDMATRNFFDHVNPDGLHSYERLHAAGISYKVMGENLGWGKGYRTPTDSVRANHEMMMAEQPPDDGHRRVILNPSLRKVGIGVIQAADGKVYYVADYTD